MTEGSARAGDGDVEAEEVELEIEGEAQGGFEGGFGFFGEAEDEGADGSEARLLGGAKALLDLGGVVALAGLFEDFWVGAFDAQDHGVAAGLDHGLGEFFVEGVGAGERGPGKIAALFEGLAEFEGSFAFDAEGLVEEEDLVCALGAEEVEFLEDIGDGAGLEPEGADDAEGAGVRAAVVGNCLLYTSPSPRDS